MVIYQLLHSDGFSTVNGSNAINALTITLAKYR